MRLDPARLRRAGVLATSAATLGQFILAAWDLNGWLHTDREYWQYTGHRVLFRVATATDAPFCQFILAGTLMWLIGRRRMRSTDRRSFEIDPRGTTFADQLPENVTAVR